MTIFALATAQGKAGVAIIRISGPKAKEVFPYFGVKTPAPRAALFSTLKDPKTLEPIDQGVLLYFAAPHSFTGEDVVELQLHGSRAVLQKIIHCLSELEGFRLAEPGEFSRRAFIHGKMDLTQAEGLADLIAAETEMQAKQAFRQMQGELQALYESWRERLIQALAYVEAYIDFPDEDIPAEVVDRLHMEVEALQRDIKEHIADNRRGERLREGLYVAIIGAPNAGKSSLLNYLARREAAIVSHIAGTTRDVIEVQLDVGGYPMVLADTAGLRETEDAIEQEGIRRATSRAKEADIKIALFDASKGIDPATEALIDEHSLVVLNKVDQVEGALSLKVQGQEAIAVSILHKQGLDTLIERLESMAAARLQPSIHPVITRARYREQLMAALGALQAFSLGKPIELAAEDLRIAANHIGRITGRIDIEEVLDVIFGQFCIGK